MIKKQLTPFISYLVLFYVAWIFVWVYGIYPWAIKAIGDATLVYALINIGFRFLIWILPVFWYLHYIDKINAIKYLQLKQYWKRGVIIGLTVAAFDFLGTIVRHGGMPNLSSAYLTWNSVLGTSILIGFFEEIPFRGFILRKLQEWFDFWTSTIISSLLFVGVHIPGWVMLGSLTAYNIIYIFIFGVVMAIILRYSKSLWAPIITHSLNDCISAIIFHL